MAFLGVKTPLAQYGCLSTFGTSRFAPPSTSPLLGSFCRTSETNQGKFQSITDLSQKAVTFAISQCKSAGSNVSWRKELVTSAARDFCKFKLWGSILGHVPRPPKPRESPLGMSRVFVGLRASLTELLTPASAGASRVFLWRPNHPDRGHAGETGADRPPVFHPLRFHVERSFLLLEVNIVVPIFGGVPIWEGLVSDIWSNLLT